MNVNKHALLVGCTYEDLPDESGYRLKGTVRDSERTGCILRHMFGFGDIHYLKGTDATFRAMLDGFQGV